MIFRLKKWFTRLIFLFFICAILILYPFRYLLSLNHIKVAIGKIEYKDHQAYYLESLVIKPILHDGFVLVDLKEDPDFVTDVYFRKISLHRCSGLVKIYIVVKDNRKKNIALRRYMVFSVHSSKCSTRAIGDALASKVEEGISTVLNSLRH